MSKEKLVEAQAYQESDKALPGSQFYAALEERARETLGGIYKTTLNTVNYPAQGDFKWWWQNINNVFNQNTFDYISANLMPGSPNTSIKMGNSGSFPLNYSQLIGNISYYLSSAEAQKVRDAQEQASQQAAAMVTNYQTTYGQITAEQMANAKVETKQDYVVGYIMGSIWSGTSPNRPLRWSEMAAAKNLKALLPAAPQSADPTITAAQLYLSIMRPVTTILDQQEYNNWIIRTCIYNAQNPSLSNGGMNAMDSQGKTKLVQGWQLNKSTQAILAALKDLSNEITLGMQISQGEGSSLNVKIEGQTQFSIGSFLNFSTSTGGSYNMTEMQGSSTQCSVKMSWKGYTMIPVAPTSFNQPDATGWYYQDVFRQAYENAKKDVSGFKFVSFPPDGFNLQNFSNGGNFGLYNNILISNYPDIEITFSNANYTLFMEGWDTYSKGNLSLFGFISLGSYSAGAYGSNVTQGADNSTFTLKFSGSPELTTVSDFDKQAYCIGGTVNNPCV